MCLVLSVSLFLCFFQAHEYEQREGVSLDEFFRSTTGKFLSTLGRALQAEVVRRRAAAADAGAGGAAVAADRLAKIGDDLADLVASKGADGFGA